MTDIIGFNGAPRSGKTLAVATLALWYMRRGYTVWSNFYIKGATMIEPRHLIEALELSMNNQQNRPLYPYHVLAAQEIYGWLESRTGRSIAELLMGYFVFYSGKMGFSIIYDAQLNSSVDKRLKQNASKRYEAEQKKDRFIYWELDLEHTEENLRTGRKRTIKKSWAEKNVFPFYHTYRVSKPIGFDEWLQKCKL